MSGDAQNATEENPERSVRAARLIRRFNTLNEEEAEELARLIRQYGNLTSLAEEGKRTLAVHPGGRDDLHTLEILHARLTAGAYTPELATILAAGASTRSTSAAAADEIEAATRHVDHTLDKVSSLLGDGDLHEAEQQLTELLQNLVDTTLTLPEELGVLFARGLIDLWADDPVWQRACGNKDIR